MDVDFFSTFQFILEKNFSKMRFFGEKSVWCNVIAITTTTKQLLFNCNLSQIIVNKKAKAMQRDVNVLYIIKPRTNLS